MMSLHDHSNSDFDQRSRSQGHFSVLGFNGIRMGFFFIWLDHLVSTSCGSRASPRQHSGQNMAANPSAILPKLIIRKLERVQRRLHPAFITRDLHPGAAAACKFIDTIM